MYFIIFSRTILHYLLLNQQFYLDTNIPNINFSFVVKLLYFKYTLEIRIVVAGIIDLLINLIRNNEYEDFEKYKSIINNFLIKWASSLDDI